MKDAAQYDVTFPYGATTAPYSPSNPHLGDDRAMPLGTPIKVNGELIGLAGTSGWSTGPHTHTMHFLAGKVVNPRGGGFNVPSATVIATGEDPVNGKWVRYGKPSDYWVQLHMSRIDVKAGEPLKGDDMVSEHILNVIHRYRFGSNATEARKKAYVGKKTPDEVDAIFVASRDYKNHVAKLKQDKADLNGHLPAEVRS